jgi:bifunctional DNA-binding transcriptional regulator/antitoxin component of YhaV-PrlF toxin-antitoxin module
MVKFKVKANPSGQYYFPKEVRAELGEELELICDAKAAVVYSKDTPLEAILESLEIIQKDLKHRLDLEKQQEAQGAAAK